MQKMLELSEKDHVHFEMHLDFDARCRAIDLKQVLEMLHFVGNLVIVAFFGPD